MPARLSAIRQCRCNFTKRVRAFPPCAPSCLFSVNTRKYTILPRRRFLHAPQRYLRKPPVFCTYIVPLSRSPFQHLFCGNSSVFCPSFGYEKIIPAFKSLQKTSRLASSLCPVRTPDHKLSAQGLCCAKQAHHSPGRPCGGPGRRALCPARGVWRISLFGNSHLLPQLLGRERQGVAAQVLPTRHG